MARLYVDHVVLKNIKENKMKQTICDLCKKVLENTPFKYGKFHFCKKCNKSFLESVDQMKKEHPAWKI